MSVTGILDEQPLRAGIPISDVSASLMAVTGILSALISRNQSNRGQHIDISMLDSQISNMNYMAMIALMSGEAPKHLGNAHNNHVPYDTYPCRDGHIILAVVTNDFWQNLVTVLNLETLDTKENRSRDGRIKNRLIIDQTLSDIFKSQTKKYWLKKLRKALIPCAPVNNFIEALEEPQIKERNMIVDVDYSPTKRVRMPGNPIKLSDTKANTFEPSPLLGQHNKEVFVGLLGISEIEFNKLKKRLVI